MNRAFQAINLLQLLVAVAAIVVFCIFPVVSFGFLGISFLGLNGQLLLRLGYTTYLIPLFLMIAMVLCSLTALKRVSLFVGAAALISLIVTGFMTSDILLGNILPLLALIPQDMLDKTGLNINTASAVLSTLINAGAGHIANMVLTAVYCLFALVPDHIYRGGGSSSNSYRDGGSGSRGGSGRGTNAYSGSSLKL